MYKITVFFYRIQILGNNKSESNKICGHSFVYVNKTKNNNTIFKHVNIYLPILKKDCKAII